MPTLPSVIASTTAQDAGAATTSITVSKPAGGQAGDIYLVLVANDSQSGTDRWNDSTYKPTGFTFIGAAGNGTSDVHCGAFWKVYDGSEGADFTVTNPSSQRHVAACLLVRDVDTSDVIDAIGADATVGSASEFTFPAATTTTDNTLAIAFAGFDGADTTSMNIFGGGWSPGGGLIRAGTTGNSASLGWNTLGVATAGSTGSPTGYSSVNDGWAGFIFALTGAPDTSGEPLTGTVAAVSGLSGAPAAVHPLTGTVAALSTVSRRVLRTQKFQGTPGGNLTAGNSGASGSDPYDLVNPSNSAAVGYSTDVPNPIHGGTVGKFDGTLGTAGEVRYTIEEGLSMAQSVTVMFTGKPTGAIHDWLYNRGTVQNHAIRLRDVEGDIRLMTQSSFESAAAAVSSADFTSMLNEWVVVDLVTILGLTDTTGTVKWRVRWLDDLEGTPIEEYINTAADAGEVGTHVLDLMQLGKTSSGGSFPAQYVADHRGLSGAVDYLPDPVPLTATAHPLTGQVDSVSATTGAISSSQRLTGTLAAVSAVSGSPERTLLAQPLTGTVALTSVTSLTGGTRTLALTGTAAADTAVTGAPVAARPLSGQAAAVSGLSGAPVAAHPLVGTVAGITSVTGAPERTTLAQPLTGTVAAQTATTGSPLAIHPLTGTAAALTTVTGDPSRTLLAHPLTGTVAAVSAVIGNPTSVHPVAGQVVAVTTLSLETWSHTRALTGQVAALTATSATPAARVGLTGTVAGVSEVISALGASVTGVITVTSATTGNPERDVVAQPLTGAVAADSTVSGLPTADHPVAGSCDAVTTVSGSALAVHPLAGTVAGVSTLTGDPQRDALALPTDGTVTVASATAGSPAQTQALTGQVSTVSGQAGAPTASHPLAAEVGAVSTVTGQVQTQAALTGSVTAVAGLDASPTARHPLGGTVGAITTVASSLGDTITGIVAATTGVSGDPVRDPVAHPLTGAVVSTTTLAGDPQRDGLLLELTGTVAVHSTVTGTPRATHPLTAAVGAVSATHGLLAVALRLSATVPATSVLTGSPSAVHPLVGTAPATSVALGEISGTQALAGVVVAVSGVSGWIGLGGAPDHDLTVVRVALRHVAIGTTLRDGTIGMTLSQSGANLDLEPVSVQGRLDPTTVRIST